MNTLVNSATNSYEELSKLQDAIVTSPVFTRYLDVYASHSSRNPHSSKITENIWPSLTGDTLVGPDKIRFRSNTLYVIDDKFLRKFGDIEMLSDHENNRSYTFFHLGAKLSGHHGIVHGGLLATILDEITCRLAFQNFKSKKGVTANLNINYKQPCYVDSYVMLKCEVIRKTGRKCWVRGQIYKVELKEEEVEHPENLLTECEILVIEPRWVEKLANSLTGLES